MTWSCPVNRSKRAAGGDRIRAKHSGGSSNFLTILIADTDVAQCRSWAFAMRSHTGVAAKMFQVLPEGVNIKGHHTFRDQKSLC